MFDTVLFDLDGTLTDPYEGVINGIRYALQSAGLDETDPARLRTFIGPPLRVTFATYGFGPEDCDRLVAKYRELYVVSGIHQTVIYPGIAETLAALSERGIRLALASCKPEDSCYRVLEEAGILRYFSVVVGATLDASMDSKPAIIACALQKLGLEKTPERCLMVGDRDTDIFGAHENGLAAVGVLYGYGSREELSAANAEFLAETPADLLKIVS